MAAVTAVPAEVPLPNIPAVRAPESSDGNGLLEEHSNGHAPGGHRAAVSAMTEEAAGVERRVSKSKSIVVIITLAGVNFLNTMGSGILIAALPKMAQEVGLTDRLILWPAAVYSLAAGCLLLIFGAVADIVGAKTMWVTGSLLYMALTLGLARAVTGMQVILLRACLGVAISMCLPTAVGLISNTFPHGPWRNAAFAMNGMGSPLGYALGLVLGGVFTDTIGWRWAYYITAIVNGLLTLASIWSLPDVSHVSEKKLMQRLVQDIDWTGAILLSTALGLLLYVLAMTTTSYTTLRQPQTASLLAVSILLLMMFPLWMQYRTRKGKPALIPNTLWKNASFSTVCIAVFLCWASLNGIEFFSTLYFQQIQKLSALQSSIRFLPHVIWGTLVNILVAYLIARFNVQTLAVISAIITMVPPILMATITVDESYWYAPFWALLLSPTNADVMFTLANLIISDSFPPELQSLAGGVFNEVSQFGNSVGLAVTAAIAASVTEHAGTTTPTDGLMLGYRSAFWTIFAGTSSVVFIVFFGLRKGGTVGKKRD